MSKRQLSLFECSAGAVTKHARKETRPSGNHEEQCGPTAPSDTAPLTEAVAPAPSATATAVSSDTAPLMEAVAPAPSATATAVSGSTLDIGNIIKFGTLTKSEVIAQASHIDSSTRYKLLTNHHRPKTFPSTFQDSCFRVFKPAYYQDRPWLIYSETLDGCLCMPCFLFATGSIRNQLDSLVNSPFSRWARASILKTHVDKAYHKDAMALSKGFISSVETPEETNIQVVLDRRVQDRIQSNREILKHMITAVIYLGKQGIALRGHREKLTDQGNRGNFIELLMVLREYDERLANHIATSTKTTYMSPDIQNQIINIIGSEIIRPSLIKEVADAKYFSIICDEAISSKKEYMSMVLRFIDNNNDIREEFLKFIPVVRTSGQMLAETILSTIDSFGLDISNCRGQGYDGAAAMSSSRRGVQGLIQERNNRALYFHCTSHCLNLVIVHSCKDISLQTTLTKISEVCTFFTYPKRRELLTAIILSQNPKLKASTPLIALCQTRWSERHTAYSHFHASFRYVIQSLESVVYDLHQEHSPSILRDSWPKAIQTEALALLKSITDFDFIATFSILYSLITPLEGITKKLQGSANDIINAYRLVKKEQDFYGMLADKEDPTWWPMALDLAEKASVEPVKPRCTSRMRNRANAPSESVQQHYHRNVYLPLLNHIQSELNSRFTDLMQKAIGVLALVANDVVTAEYTEFEQATEPFRDDLPSPQAVNQEFRRWKSHCSSLSDRPKTLAETIKVCDYDLYPNIYTMIKIASCWPVTSCEYERSFSGLRRLNTYLRATQSSERLDNIALMHIHHGMKLDVDQIIECFARLHPRRMQLTDVLHEDKS